MPSLKEIALALVAIGFFSGLDEANGYLKSLTNSETKELHQIIAKIETSVGGIKTIRANACAGFMSGGNAI